MNDFTIIWKNLFRKKLRTILMLIAIFVAFFLYGMLASVGQAFDSPGSSDDKNRMVTLNKINFTQFLPISYYDRVLHVKGVTQASHSNWFGTYYQDKKNVIVGFAVDPKTYLSIYTEFSMPDAERNAFLADRVGLAVGRAIADKYGWKVGQTVPISSNIFSQKNGSHSWDFKVDAIFDNSKIKGRDGLMIFHYDYYNETVSFGRDNIGLIIFTTETPDINDSVAKNVDAMFANSPYETSTDTAEAFNKSFIAQLGNIKLIISLVVGAAFVTILLIVGNTMVMAIRERTKEIGVFKTLGFSGERIFSQIVAEALLLSLIGGLLGLSCAVPALLLINKISAGAISGLSVQPIVFIKGIGWMVLLGLVTAILPAWSAMRLNIVTALGRK